MGESRRPASKIKRARTPPSIGESRRNSSTYSAISFRSIGRRGVPMAGHPPGRAAFGGLDMQRCARALAMVAFLLALPLASQAERGWVKDEVVLYKRTGPGTQFRILGAVKTGENFQILERTEKWTKVQDEKGDAWIPVGFLQPEPPARILLERHLAETKELRGNAGKLTTELEELRTANATLTKEHGALQERFKKVERENIELRAGARWPEWIAGASILMVGGILGIIVHSATARRQTRRIRL